jgi:murein DD-endopeptidase MepM/ murein hydrolase activator NlpD
MLRVFPVAWGARFSDDFGQPRPGGRSHHGNDLLAPKGTPVLAVDDGTVAAYVDPLGGNAVLLHAPDATTYYYAHLDRWEKTSGRVFAGDVLGYVGTTGDAKGTAAHLHFEVHPLGGGAIDPYPMLLRAERRGPPRPTTAAPSSRAALAALGVVLSGGLLVALSFRRA